MENIQQTTAMTIEVQIKSVYGNDRIIPVCQRAKAFASIAGTLTLTRSAINGIKALGYQIRVIQDVKEI